MEIIDELEPSKRGAYAGVVGYVDFSGNLDTAIAIRTMVWRDGQASVQAGAGIVADSVAGRRRPGMPQQGPGVAHCSGRGAPASRHSDRPREAAHDRRRRARSVLRTRRRRGSTVPTAASCSSPAPTRSRSCRRWCRPISTRCADGDAVHSLAAAHAAGQARRRLPPPARRRRRVARLRPRHSARSSQASLNRFRIRVKAEVVDRSDEWGMLSLIGPDVSTSGPGPSRRAPRARARRRAARGPHRARASTSSAPARWIDSVPPASPPTAGRPSGPRRSTRAASNAASRCSRSTSTRRPSRRRRSSSSDAVSFTKGCFLGQELVCRIDSRGHVNRFLRRFTDDRRRLARSPAPRWSSTARSSARSRASPPPALPTGALGYVRREVEPPATVELRWDGGHATASITER